MSTYCFSARARFCAQAVTDVLKAYSYDCPAPRGDFRLHDNDESLVLQREMPLCIQSSSGRARLRTAMLRKLLLRPDILLQTKLLRLLPLL